MHTSAIAFQLLKVAGVAYIFYLAIIAWTDKSTFSVDYSSSGGSTVDLIIKAFVLDVLNPRLTIFFLAFIPQFIPPSGGSIDDSTVCIKSCFYADDYSFFGVYGFVAHSFRKVVI